MGLRLARSKLKDPQTIVVGAPPPPQCATLLLALAPISRKLHLGRVRGLSRKTIEVPRASKKQSPPVRGIGSGIPSTLSQQLPRESMAKCAKSVGDIFLSEGVTFSSVWFSCFMPHGAVASSLCRPKAATCIVLKMSVIESNLAFSFGRIDKRLGLPSSSRLPPKNSTLLYPMLPIRKGVIMGKLKGKVAVITGGATGIGRAAAKRFIEEGAFVFIFGRRQAELDAAVAALGPNARAVKGSVSDLADLDQLYAAVKAERGTLDIVFANAGAGSPLPLGKITAEHIDETFDTNVKGTIFTVQKALPLMGKGGSIILTGSSAGTTGAPGMSAYSASKAAVRNLARTWAEDLKGTGIRVNVLSPGATATELAKAALGEEGQKVYAAMTPLQRMADPAEIGAVAAFLASQDSSFMTASEVAVDGGLAQL